MTDTTRSTGDAPSARRSRHIAPPRAGARRLFAPDPAARALRCAASALVVLRVALSPAGAGAFGGDALKPVPPANASANYPRVIRLTHSGALNGTLIATHDNGSFFDPNVNGNLGFPIYQSTDDGETWTRLTIVNSDPAYANLQFMLNPVLFEAPTALGAQGQVPAGTLFLAGNTLGANIFTVPIKAISLWRSDDHGATWTSLPQIATSTDPTKGVWEPWLVAGPSGKLVAFFSDERNLSYSQLIGHLASTDGGASWPATPTVDVAVAGGPRPGMPVVIKLPDASFLMSFEYVGGQMSEMHVKHSTSLTSWGTASDLGSRVQTASGDFLGATPFISWSPGGGANGTVIAIAKVLVSCPGGTCQNAFTNGTVALTNDNADPTTGSWVPITLPIGSTPEPTISGDCNHYSGSILPAANGTSYLYLTPHPVSDSAHCQIVYGRGTAGTIPFVAPLGARPGATAGRDIGFVPTGGTWTLGDGTISDTKAVSDDVTLTGSDETTDFDLSGDVRVDSTSFNAGAAAGFVLRATHDGAAPNDLAAYFVGVAPGASPTLVLTALANGTARTLATAVAAPAVVSGQWLHLTVQVKGCNVRAALQAVNAQTEKTIAASDCAIAAGAIGLRAALVKASWRNVSVTPAPGTITAATTPYYLSVVGGATSSWTTYGGSWSASAATETYSDTLGGAGDKSVAGGTGVPSRENLTWQADVMATAVNDPDANPGLIARVTVPAVGVDALNGYYAGFTTDASASPAELVIGRENDSWTQLAAQDVVGGVSVGRWYHLTFDLAGCNLSATLQPVWSARQTVVTVTDPAATCIASSGKIGVRTFSADAGWRFVAATAR